MGPLITGLGFGMLFSISFGPGFFTLIQTSIRYGRLAAGAVAGGITSSDITCVLMILLGANVLMENPTFQRYMGILGVLLLVGYGLFMWLSKPEIAFDRPVVKSKSLPKYFAKGYLINGINPLIIVFWFGVASLITVRFQYSLTEKLQFFAGVHTMIFCLDLVKGYLANSLRNRMTRKTMLILNRGLGILLFGFAAQVTFFLVLR